MADGKSPLSRLVEAELKSEEVMRDLRQMAMHLTGSHEEDAKDLFARALVRVVDPDGDPWRPGAHSFLAHMCVAMRQLRYRRRRRIRLESEVFDGGFLQETAANDDPRADDEAHRMGTLALHRRLGEQLLARLPSDSLARKLYENAMKEDLDPSEEAIRFGRTIAEIRAARAQLKYHGRIVLGEWNESEERRMKSVRKPARTEDKGDTP
jgi:hypothetical protein